MKIQDILFVIVFVVLLVLRKPKWFIYSGLGSLTGSMVLYARWVFFTAERLTWYAAALFLVSILLSELNLRRSRI